MPAKSSPVETREAREDERLVKIFELAFPLEVTPLPSPPLRLVFLSTLIHTRTQRHYGRQKLRGEAMDWKHLCVFTLPHALNPLAQGNPRVLYGFPQESEKFFTLA